MPNPAPPAIAPALTPEEWQAIGGLEPTGEIAVYDAQSGRLVVVAERRHAIAAIALHGQPYGFAQADVELLYQEIDEEYPNTWRNKDLRSLMDRIAALLPPPDAAAP